MTKLKYRKLKTPAIPGLPRFTYYAADCPQCHGRGAIEPTLARCLQCEGSGQILKPGQESPAAMLLRRQRERTERLDQSQAEAAKRGVSSDDLAQRCSAIGNEMETVAPEDEPSVDVVLDIAHQQLINPGLSVADAYARVKKAKLA